jgi:predicted DNA-binding transcriptional regulator AlpA
MTQQYLRTKDAAKYLSIGQSTLERKRIEGNGPKFRKLGQRMVTYTIDDLDAWASQNIRNSILMACNIHPQNDAPKPDPLVEVAESLGYFNTAAQGWAGDVRAALEARGLEIRSKANDRH